jgi:hypothetical protein
MPEQQLTLFVIQTMPVLAVGGQKSMGEVLGQQMKRVASNVKVVVLEDTGTLGPGGTARRDDRRASGLSLILLELRLRKSRAGC